MSSPHSSQDKLTTGQMSTLLVTGGDRPLQKGPERAACQDTRKPNVCFSPAREPQKNRVTEGVRPMEPQKVRSRGSSRVFQRMVWGFLLIFKDLFKNLYGHPPLRASAGCIPPCLDAPVPAGTRGREEVASPHMSSCAWVAAGSRAPDESATHRCGH